MSRRTAVMAKSDEFFDLLRSHGLRKKVAKPLSALDGNGRSSGAAGEKLARQTVDDLTAVADAIRKRVLKRDHTRSQAARKAAQTRKRNTAKRVSSGGEVQARGHGPRRGRRSGPSLAASPLRAEPASRARRPGRTRHPRSVVAAAGVAGDALCSSRRRKRHGSTRRRSRVNVPRGGCDFGFGDHRRGKESGRHVGRRPVGLRFDPDQLGAVMSNFGFPSSEDRLDTEPRGRVCATDGCDTILSRYNRADHCGVHENGLVVAARPRTRVSRLGHEATPRSSPRDDDSPIASCQ